MATNNAWNSQKPAQVSVGGTGATTFTAYGTMIGGSTSTSPLVSIDPGKSGDVLTSRGSGQTPIYQSPSGGLVLLSTQAASTSSAINFNSLITSTYKNYMVQIAASISDTTSNFLIMQWSTDNGSTFLSSNFLSTNIGTAYNSATASANNSTTTIAVGRSGSVGTSDYIFATIYLFNLATAIPPYYVGRVFTTVNAGNSIQHTSGSTNSTTSGVNALRFNYNSGNILSGTFSLYAFLE